MLERSHNEAFQALARVGPKFVGVPYKERSLQAFPGVELATFCLAGLFTQRKSPKRSGWSGLVFGVVDFVAGMERCR